MADGTAHYAEKVGDTQHYVYEQLWTFFRIVDPVNVRIKNDIGLLYFKKC